MLEFLTFKHNLIAPFGWERDFTDATGFSVDQLRLVLAAFLAVLVAPGVRLFKSPARACRRSARPARPRPAGPGADAAERALPLPAVRNLYCLATGCLLTYYPFGSGVVHVFPPAFLTFCTLHLVPRKAGTLAWLICFPYLLAM
jgi:lysophospholipid acyltransferase